MALLGSLLGAPVEREDLKVKEGRRTTRARGCDRSAIVKVFPTEHWARKVAERIRAVEGGQREPEVSHVLALWPRLRTVVLSDVPGVSLRSALRANDASECERAGAAIGRWHLVHSGLPPLPLRAHTVQREIDVLRWRAEGAPPEVRSRALAAASGLAAPWGCTTAVHRDLQDEHVLMYRGVGLIDLDNVAAGPPELDIGNFVAQVERQEVRTKANYQPALNALLRGHSAQGPPLEPELAERCRKLALLRLACLHGDPRLIDLSERGWTWPGKQGG